jgi:hypothetical protein
MMPWIPIVRGRNRTIGRPVLPRPKFAADGSRGQFAFATASKHLFRLVTDRNAIRAGE